jgi:hypothetical protein
MCDTQVPKAPPPHGPAIPPREVNLFRYMLGVIMLMISAESTG